jgi:hypothetical protein
MTLSFDIPLHGLPPSSNSSNLSLTGISGILMFDVLSLLVKLIRSGGLGK